MSTLQGQALQKPQPHQLHDAETDDWVQPFSCNHVVVNNSQTTNGYKGKEKVKDSPIQSYCVMCGETNIEMSRNIDREDGDDKPLPNAQIHTEEIDNMDAIFTERLDMRRQFFRKSSSKQLTLPSVVACAMHSHKKIKYYCEDHQEICCSVCVNVLHPKCERVMFIKTEINSTLDTKICSETMEVLQVIGKSFEDIMEYNGMVLEMFEKQVKEVKNKRKEMRTKLIELLDEFDKNSDKMIQKFTKTTEREIKSTVETCEDAIHDLEISSELLKTAMKSKNPSDIFVATQKVLGQKECYARALSSAITHTKDMHLEFKPETNISSLEHLDKIGKIQFSVDNVRFKECVLASVSKIPKADVRSPRNVKDVFTARSLSSSSLSPRAPTLHGKFNVRLADDKDSCENVGATFLPEGRVAIVDMKNCRLKVFDAKFRQGSCLKLSSGPRGITLVSPQEVAITLPDESKIQFVSTTKKLKPTCSILTNLPCYGIDHYNQELVVLCDDGFSAIAIQILDLSGKIKRTITMNKSNKVLLKNPWHLALNPDGQQICITDRGRLVCIDISGSVIFKYTDENLENARGVAIDDLGRFYVCGANSNNVHQISHDGKKLKVIVTDEDIAAPQAVCYNPEKRLLLLTSVGSEMVTVFKINSS